MRMDARIATEVTQIITARERTAPSKRVCPLCKIGFPKVHILDKDFDRVYVICLPCAKEYIAKYGPGISGEKVKDVFRTSIMCDLEISEVQNTTPPNITCTPTKGVAPSNEDVQQPELFTAKTADSSPALRG